MSEPGTCAWTIRDCLEAEAGAVVELWRAAGATPSVTDSAEEVRRALTKGPARVLVAEVKGRLVGSLIATFDGWRGNFYRLAVHPEFRRHGIGRALVVEGEKHLARQGARRLSALVESDHPWATAFWEAAGYAMSPLIRRYVKNTPDGQTR